MADIPLQGNSQASQQSLTFMRRSETTYKGHDYENLMVANIALTSALDENVKNFALSTYDKYDGTNYGINYVTNYDPHDKNYGLVFELELTDGSVHKHVMKLKYSNDSKSLTVAQLTTEPVKTGKGGKLGIPKCFEEYHKLSKIHGNFTLILSTNRKWDNSDPFTIKDDCLEIKIKTVKTEPMELFRRIDTELFCHKIEIVEERSRIDSTEKLQEYEEFFNNFLLFTDQMQVEELKESVLNTVEETFCCTRSVSEEYLEYIETWSKLEGEKTKLHKTLTKGVLALRLLSPYITPLVLADTSVSKKSKLFREALSNFQITFLHNEHVDTLKSLWGDAKNDSTFDIKAAKQILTDYQIKPANDLNDEQLTKIFWLTSKCPLIVSDNLTTRKVLESLCKDMTFVLCGDSNSAINFSAFTNLSDLKRFPGVYDNILNTFTCSVQNERVIALRDLILIDEDLAAIFTTNELVQMVNGKLDIGRETEELPAHHIYRSIPRTTIKYEFLHEKTRDTFVLISSWKNDSTVPEHLRDFEKINIAKVSKDQSDNSDNPIYVSDEQCSKEEFDLFYKIIQNKSQNRNCKVHQFRITKSKHLEWVRSNGDIRKLSEYKTQDEYVKESELFCYEKDNNVNIVTADSGMGKSTLMKSFKKYNNTSGWTMLINARDHSRHFQESKDDVAEFQKYISHQITADHPEINRKLIEIFMKQGLLRYLWDGLDEVLEGTMETILNLIDKLSRSGVRNWLTSRNNLKSRLENRFGVISKTIREFNDEEQRRYIGGRLKCSDENLGNVFEKIKHSIPAFPVNNILGIPLNIHMLTELFCQEQERWTQSLSNIFSIADLYNHFVEIKLEMYYAVKQNSDTTNDKKSTIKMYEDAAVQSYFNEVSAFKFTPENFLCKLPNEKDSVGFITEITQNSCRFVHNTFGEYFAARYLSKNFQIARELKNYIFQEKYNNVRFFFDLMLAKDSVAHIAVLYKNVDILKNCGDEDLKRKDQGGRSALQVASSWGTRCKPLEFIKEGHACSIKEDYNFERKRKRDWPEFTNERDSANEIILEYLVTKLDPLEIDHAFKINSFSYACLLSSFITLAILAQNCKRHPPEFTDNILNIICYCAHVDYDKIFAIADNIPLIAGLIKIAVKNNSSNSFKELLTKDIDNTSVDETANELLKLLEHATISDGTITTIKGIIFENFFTRLHYPLHLAASFNFPGDIKKLIENGYNVEGTDENGDVPINNACRWGSEETARMLIERGVRLDVANKNGDMPIHLACGNVGVEMVRMLVERGVEMEVANKDGDAPIHLACRNGGVEIVRLLVEGGVGLEAANKDGDMPIHLACQNGNVEMVRMLVARGIGLGAAAKFGDLPLHLAFRSGRVEVVRMLVEKGVGLEVTSIDGDMPIHLACIRGYDEIVRMLVERGVGLEVADQCGDLPIHLACRRRREPVVVLFDSRVPVRPFCQKTFAQSVDNQYDNTVRILIEKGVGVEVPNEEGNMPIHLACDGGHDEIVRMLVEIGVGLEVANKCRDMPIHLACRSDRPEVVRMLVERGVRLGVATLSGDLPIHLACRSGRVETVRLLVEKGVGLEVADKCGFMPIHVACMRGYDEIVRMLVDRGVGLEMANKIGDLPIHLACTRGYDEIVRMLVDAGVGLEMTNKKGDMPMHLACRVGNNTGLFDGLGVSIKDGRNVFDAIVRIFVERGVGLEVANKDGDMPLHLACRNGGVGIVRLLVEVGVGLEVANKRGDMPIHLACSKGRDEIVRMLAGRGVRLEVATFFDDLPIHLACRNGRVEILQILVEKGVGLEVANGGGDMPIHLACSRGHYDIVHMLVDRGVELEMANKNGDMPIHLACRSGNEMFGIFGKREVELGMANKDGRSERDGIVQMLVERGVGLEVANMNGDMPIHLACRNEGVEIVRMLVEGGAGMEVTNRVGDTPIHLACRNGCVEIVRLLVERGVGLEVANKNGDLPMDLARKYGSDEIVRMMLKKASE